MAYLALILLYNKDEVSDKCRRLVVGWLVLVRTILSRCRIGVIRSFLNQSYWVRAKMCVARVFLRVGIVILVEFGDLHTEWIGVRLLAWILVGRLVVRVFVFNDRRIVCNWLFPCGLFVRHRCFKDNGLTGEELTTGEIFAKIKVKREINDKKKILLYEYLRLRVVGVWYDRYGFNYGLLNGLTRFITDRFIFLRVNF
jgi:hypothetical protein